MGLFSANLPAYQCICPSTHILPTTYFPTHSFAYSLPSYPLTYPTTYLPFHLHTSLHTYMYIPTQVYLLSDCLPPHPLTYALNYLPSSLHVYLFTYLPTYLCSYPFLFPSSFKSNPILASFTNTFLISGCMEKDF